MKVFSARRVDHLAAWILAGVFLVAAIPKLAYPDELALAIFRYRLVPYAWINPLALLLPGIELAAAVALIAAPSWRRGAAAVLALLLLVFVAAGLSARLRGLDIACGCFGAGGSSFGAAHLLGNLALLACCARLLLRRE